MAAFGVATEGNHDGGLRSDARFESILFRMKLSP